jgi:hypothetical protein
MTATRIKTRILRSPVIADLDQGKVPEALTERLPLMDC